MIYNNKLIFRVAYILFYDKEVTIWSLRILKQDTSIISVYDSDDDLSNFARTGTAFIEFLEEPKFNQDLSGLKYTLHFDRSLSFLLQINRNLQDLNLF